MTRTIKFGDRMVDNCEQKFIANVTSFIFFGETYELN
jgi:hypothetical protein